MQDTFEALFFDASGEQVYVGTGPTVAAAVRAANNAMCSGTPPDPADDIMANIGFSLPGSSNDPNVLLNSRKNWDTLLSEGVPFLIIWGCERMHVPLGVVHRQS